MYKYELGIVLDPTLSAEEKVAFLDQMKKLIEGFDGEVIKMDDWGKRRLAYEINKIKEGFYCFIQFNANGDVPSQIESRIRIMDPVLRYLTVRMEED